MNCSTCGAPLPERGGTCSRCGTALSYLATMTETGPDDPTVGSVFEERRIPPPPPSASGFSPYQHLDRPYADPPSSARHTGRYLVLLLGALLLGALLLGGGLLAWPTFSAASNAATSTRTAQTQIAATASAAAVPQTFAAQGSATVLKSASPLMRQEGSSMISAFTQQGAIEGGLAGSYTNEEVLTLSPDNTGTFSGQMMCSCTVAGKSGTLTWSYTGTEAADGSFQGQFFDIQGSGDLADLHGQGKFQGQGEHLTYSSELHFAA
jgi:hypothetical protein